MTASTPEPLSQGLHSFTAEGLTVAFHVHGTGPICVAHPGGPGFTWDYLRMPELERHLTMVYLEPIGTGRSDRLPAHPHGYTRDRYSTVLERLLRHLGRGPVHLLGHSHGGFVAQYHAVHRPGGLAGIILYESAPSAGSEHFAEADRSLRALLAERPDARPEILDVWESVPTIGDDAAFTHAARALFPAYVADHRAREEEYRPFRDAITGTYISGLDTDQRPEPFDDRHDLKSVTIPALVIVGAHDFICGPRWAAELHRLLPDSRLLTLHGSGHFGHIEEPAAFAEGVVSFVTGGWTGFSR
ncbi:alpha/beta fold hydrolase [Nonomuraea sp. NPDC001831]|uniref:alpha/beta fold hydrolase n=1 Tax=Nonomuraea sp. NPDC001831 TaxID=3364340 RepID=UPI0036AE6257